ncbi:unnamed protein product [Dovyalis caffra]|uniref:Uncharacterized protein n=1 Tax=Dovyalis caffra TaxID=77055 RepID=A0AAV1SRJ3_9ROSI|nr:unnamed protein product [Dovyalis caffra]
MKKTFSYNFLPTKAEEEAAVACNKPHQVTRTLVEITDIYLAQSLCTDPKNPWKIRKCITSKEILTGKILISHEDMFEHVFRYWTLEMAKHVILGNTSMVILIDYSGKRFKTGDAYVKNGPIRDTYVVGFMDVIRMQGLNPGDEIGIFWDRRGGTFGFKLLGRGDSVN